jgi:hypothetical protein
MWIVGDWGQASPWSRASGVIMTKGDDGVWTGELSLPKGTKFDIKILRSTVSGTSGGDNAWSAVRYASTLNMSASHNFGEFTDNLIPNGNFEEGDVKRAPPNSIINMDYAESKPYLLVVSNATCTSDVFDIPANQQLRFSGQIRAYEDNIGTIDATVESVEPQRRTLLKFSPATSGLNIWDQFSESFESGSIPTKCRIVIKAIPATGVSFFRRSFDTLSIVSP